MPVVLAARSKEEDTMLQSWGSLIWGRWRDRSCSVTVTPWDTKGGGRVMLERDHVDGEWFRQRNGVEVCRYHIFSLSSNASSTIVQTSLPLSPHLCTQPYSSSLIPRCKILHFQHSGAHNSLPSQPSHLKASSQYRVLTSPVI